MHVTKLRCRLVLDGACGNCRLFGGGSLAWTGGNGTLQHSGPYIRARAFAGDHLFVLSVCSIVAWPS